MQWPRPTRVGKAKVPFAACRFKHIERVNPEALKNHREFIDERNIQVALGVFYNLAASATFRLLALWVPASIMLLYSASTASATSGVLPLVIFVIL